MSTDLPAREIPTDPDMPMPEVPLVSGDNLKLVDVGADNLETYITYPGIAIGDQVAPNVRAVNADGLPWDLLTEKKTVTDLDDQNRFRIYLPNSFLQELSGGQVFYSFYTVKDDTFLAQSLRRFFFVDKKDEGGGAVGLPVLQLQQSHELQVDLKALGSDNAILAIVPYQAMAEGDEATFIYQAFIEGFDDPFIDWNLTVTVAAEQVGKAILAELPNSELKSAQGLTGKMYYRIAYKDIADESTSPVQLNFPVAEVLPAPLLLAPPLIKSLVGDILDPDDWPDGVFVQIPYHEDMLAGAGVVLYIDGLQPSIQAVQLDPSSADSKRLEFHLSQQWLRDRRNQDIRLSYQFGVVGKDGRSESLDLTVAANLKLAPATVQGAVPDDSEDLRASVPGWTIREGTEIILPSDQDLPPGPKYTAYWDGHERYSSTVPIGTSLHYRVPKDYIPANLGKEVAVYYEVEFGEGKAWTSPVLKVFVKDFETARWETITTPGFGSTVSLAAVDEDKGLPLLLGFWKFMAKDQNVRIEALGKIGGDNKTFVIRDGDPVTEEEAQAEQIEAAFNKADLASLDLHAPLYINVAVSFDGEKSYKDFPHLSKQLTV